MRILIADDHAVVRRGLSEILLEAYPAATIEQAGDADTLLQRSTEEAWDIVISDLMMPGRSVLEVLQQLRQVHPQLPVLVLSIFPEEQYATRVFKAGAAGYINKDAAPTELVKAVERILQGRKYITARIAEKLAGDLSLDKDKAPHELLSDREFHVMKLLATGKTITEIAGELSLSTTTISTYRSRIMGKMKMKANAELARYALENGLI
ncbi:MAG TPA: response regulator transcription factor [Puia sp.]|nr:response regulator transcription factor [Puia sp.]